VLTLRLRSRVFAAALAALSFAPRAASASPGYPGLIDEDLKLTYDLGTTHCTFCHATNSGGVGTVVQPFGVAMKAAGLTMENPPSLQNALTTMGDGGTDSDCDGTPDVQQIEEGRDPNTGVYVDGSGRTAPAVPGCVAAGPTGGSLPEYGCVAQLAPGAAGATSMGSAMLLASLTLGASLARRRRIGRSAARPRGDGADRRR
jgi:hypothetical protein